ncbi:MAG: L-aspartate oxidase [Phycisphaerales bacterium]|nr:L-aspartate oxidase [Phycisphaerales bacterium]
MLRQRYLIPFRSLLLPHIFTDTLVIGSGVAGLRAAIEASRFGSVIVVTKDQWDLSSTAWAQGGIAAVLAAEDSVEEHVRDTLAAGAELCEEEAVRTLVGEGPDRIAELIDWGMRFDREPGGGLSLGREGGHLRNRIVHTDGDATGRELARCLHAVAVAHDNIRMFDRCFSLDLLTTSGNGARSDNRVLGAITHHPRYGLQIIWAKATVLASGGAGQLFRETTNPRTATGDGLAMAWRAGAMVADLEFVQFHPTTLYVAGAARALISEAVRGEGAHLIDREGHRFMAPYHPLGELAPRDVVSRAIVDHIARSREPNVFLDMRHFGPGRFAARFPGLTKVLRSFDLDPETDLIPVHPAAHYTLGGVWTDLDGRSSLPGLIACGEVACTGLHGANRLASNSLLEGLVFGRRAGIAAGELASRPLGPTQIISDIRLSEHGELDLVDVRSSLRSAMWRNAGIERTGAKLDDLLDMFGFWSRYTLDKIFDDPAGWEAQNLLTVGTIVARAARAREESRGTHCRLDFPEPVAAQHHHLAWSAGAEEPTSIPVGAMAEALRGEVPT